MSDHGVGNGVSRFGKEHALHGGTILSSQLTDCLGDPPAAEQVNITQTKTAVKTQKVEQKIASVALKIVKPAKPAPTKTAIQKKLQPGSEAWNNYCTTKYASYNVKTGTYTSKTGVARKCVVFYP